MSVYYIGYGLRNGYIHNWLAAGPQAIPVPDLDRFQGDDFELQIARHYYTEGSGINGPPVERATFTLDGAELTWHYVRCLDDHFVDLSAFYPTCRFLRSWAYTQVVSPSLQEVTLVLTTHGPADLWLNGQHIQRQEGFYGQTPKSVSIPVKLEEGHNEVLVRLEQVAIRECLYAVALQIIGPSSVDVAEEVSLRLPTSIKGVARRQHLERIFEAAYQEKDVYSGSDPIIVRWPEDLATSAEVMVRLQTPAGRIYAEAHTSGAADDRGNLDRASALPVGPYQAVLMPRPKEYYDWNMRIKRTLNLWANRSHHSAVPFGTYQERRLEALNHAAVQSDGVFAEIAKMALEQWSRVKPDALMAAIEGINRREAGSALNLIGLLGMMYRYGKHDDFPAALKNPLESCVLDYRYWLDEPGSDALCFTRENQQILFHTCEILAGQLYADQAFTNTDQSGHWHREKGEQLAISWLHKRGTGGFREWDSNRFFQEDLLALVHLVDLVENPQVWELAAIVMDKLFFTIALNSYRGVVGGTHGRTDTASIKSGRLESTAGIGRLMWGMGTLNHHLPGIVGLACAEEYELPSIIQDIAADLPEEMWNRERHTGELEEPYDLATGTWEVDKVTYKTPDYMLSSAQDYRPGARGSQEHVWQATLGPDALVFVTHPLNMSEKDSQQPNFWRGNAILPRVAQWRDVLIAIHKLPEIDWMGFTHAYFPVHVFDEHALRDDTDGHRWAFAQMGAGYVAVTAAQGIELITRGESAYRELRSYGQHNVWLCHMGRAAQDGSFGEFQAKILALQPGFEGLSLKATTLRGESLAFGWEGPLIVDGKDQPITGFKHYENPYCEADWPVSQMEIRFSDQLLTLDFRL